MHEIVITSLLFVYSYTWHHNRHQHSLSSYIYIFSKLARERIKIHAASLIGNNSYLHSSLTMPWNTTDEIVATLYKRNPVFSTAKNFGIRRDLATVITSLVNFHHCVHAWHVVEHCNKKVHVYWLANKSITLTWNIKYWHVNASDENSNPIWL